MNSVSLIVIARNEERCIGRCLKSAMPFVDQTVVLDTGSSDNTKGIAKDCGALVFDFEWCDDFSAARNAAISRSRTAWNLILDADEWVSNPKPWGQLRHHLESCISHIGEIKVNNALQTERGKHRADTWIPRILPKGVCYTGRIHEQPNSSLPSLRLPLSVSHDGYLPERARTKHDRNIRLIEAALHAKPNDAYLYYQAGVQYEICEDWALACDAYEKSAALGGYQQLFGHELGFRQLYALKNTLKYEQALQLGLALLEAWPNSSDVHFTFGDVCLDLACREPQNALTTWLPAAENAWLKCLEIGEDHVPTAVHVFGRGSYLAAHNLAVIYEGLGQKSEAERFRALAEHRPHLETESI